MVLAAHLSAQECAGLPSRRDASVLLSGSLQSYSYGTRLAASATLGRTVFGTVGAGRTRDRDLDASTIDIGLEAGADIADRERRLFLCPIAAVSVSLGPRDFLLTQTDYRYVNRAVGLGAGALAVKTARLAGFVSGGVRAARLTVRALPSAEKRATGSLGRSQSDNYWLLTFGVGFVLDERVAIRPDLSVPLGLSNAPSALAVPFGRQNGELGFGVAIGIVLGGTRRGRGP